MTAHTLTGSWCLDTVRLPAAGISRKGDAGDFMFAFLPDSRATVCIHGETYSTGYRIRNQQILFDRPKIAAMRLRQEGDLLCLQNYHGVTLLFRKQPDGQPSRE